MAEPDGTDRVHLRVDRLAQAMEAARTRARQSGEPKAAGDTAKPADAETPLAGSAADAGTGAAEPRRPAAHAPAAAMPTTGESAHAPAQADGSSTPACERQVAPTGRSCAPARPDEAAPAPVEAFSTRPMPTIGEAAGDPVGPLVLTSAERVDQAPATSRERVTRLSVRGLRVVRDGRSVIDGVDLDLTGGRVTALIGPSRAGSAVLLRAIMGLERARAGSIRFDDTELRGWSTARIARAGLGYLPADGGVFLNLSVAENLALAMQGGTTGRARRDWVCGVFPAVGRMRDLPAAELLAPQRRLLALARALVPAKQVYLLDRPAVGLPPGTLPALKGALAEIRRSGAAILLAEEPMAASCGLADDVLAIEAGRVIGASGRTGPSVPQSVQPISSARAALGQSFG